VPVLGSLARHTVSQVCGLQTHRSLLVAARECAHSSLRTRYDGCQHLCRICICRLILMMEPTTIAGALVGAVANKVSMTPGCKHPCCDCSCKQYMRTCAPAPRQGKCCALL
jgi:hypothetical protein